MRAAHHEDALVAALVGAEWRIDPDGSIWRIAASTGGKGGKHGGGGRYPVRPIVPRRTEIAAPDGYLRIQGNPWGTGQRRALAHRVVWVHFNGPIPAGMEINHRNGVKHDNRPENLELVTPRQNALHRVRVLKHKPWPNRIYKRCKSIPAARPSRDGATAPGVEAATSQRSTR